MARRTSSAYRSAYRGNVQNELQANNRTYIARVVSVDDDNGRMRIQTVDAVPREYTVQIPLGEFSVNRELGLRSSWFRCMPQADSYVKISFESDGTPQVIGAAAYGEEYDVEGGRVGGPAVPRQGAYASARRLARANVDGLQIFRRLYQGEFDARSRGGAEFYGNRYGTLSLAGGPVSMTLNKKQQLEAHRSRLTTWSNDGVEVRWGDVRRRLLPGRAEVEPVPPNPAAIPAVPGVTSTLRELKISVGWPKPPDGTPLTYWDMDAGTVTGPGPLAEPVLFTPSVQGAPQTTNPAPAAAAAVPLMYRQRIYSGLAPSLGVLPNVTVQVTAQGDIQVDSTNSLARVGFSTSAQRQYHHAVTTATLASSLPTAGIFLGSEGCLQGPTARPEAFVLGTAWALERVAMHGALAGASSALSAVAATVASTAPAALTIPALAGMVAALAAAVATFATSVGVAIGNFESGGGAGQSAAAATGYLSLKVFGE